MLLLQYLMLRQQQPTAKQYCAGWNLRLTIRAKPLQPTPMASFAAMSMAPISLPIRALLRKT